MGVKTMPILSKSLFAAILLILPATAFAKTITMHCIVKGDPWIAEEIIFEYNEELDAARVIDGIIMHFEKKAMVAEISEDTAKKLVITWRVNARVSSKTTKMAYRLAYFKKNNKVLVRAHPHGFVNNFAGRGSCKAAKAPFPKS